MGGEAKMTIMILKVDLQCERCYKKVKKILCKFPQIRDQIFDEKGDKVMIKVWCCSPEKIRDKLCCKGGGTIKSIEIVEPPKKEPEKPKPESKAAPPTEPKPAEKPKPADKPKDKEPEKKVVFVGPPQPKAPDSAPKAPKPDPKPAEKPPKAPEPAPKPAEKPPKSPEPVQKAPEPVQKAPEPVQKAPEPAPKAPEPVQVFAAGYPPMYPPVGHCCMECYHGRGGGPCWHGFGTPPPPPPGCDYGRPVYYDGYGGMNRCNYNSHCTYFSEENPSACTVM